jgi:hypothetical protein
LLGRRVAIEHRDADFILQHPDQFGNERGLARANRAHEVDRGDALFLEQGAIFFRQFFVRLQQAVLEFDVVDLVR